MSSRAEMQLLYRIGNAPVQLFPFPHIYVRDVFPADFYKQLRAHIPPKEHFDTLKNLGRVEGAYPDSRLVLPITPDDVGKLNEPYRSFWHETGAWLITGELTPFILAKFEGILSERFANAGEQQFLNEALLVQDFSTYSLPPHTDSPKKVLSFLFYLPEDESLSHLGTSIYVPKDRRMVSDGGGYCRAEDFDLVMTMPYVPNTLFAFVKTPNAFHGVEAIQEKNIRRDLLLFDIRTKGAAPSALPVTNPGAKAVRFTF
jgi:hypothetical protein